MEGRGPSSGGGGRRGEDSFETFGGAPTSGGSDNWLDDKGRKTEGGQTLDKHKRSVPKLNI
eukprot:5905999-Amphidinium_carterae.1